PKQKGRTSGQVILIDTPGVHKPDSSLGRKMMTEVRQALGGCNLILVITDVMRRRDPGDEFVLDLVKKSGTPAFLLLSKIDRLGREKEKRLAIIEEYRKRLHFQEIIPISAQKRDGLELRPE